ncbi:MAG: hypothetical protein K8T10_16555 [Candidatus Eremiobacteraeota bacterium]|nr:hypothetical protein [Candidatus Eremiobacteraeota bacterium]
MGEEKKSGTGPVDFECPGCGAPVNKEDINCKYCARELFFDLSEDGDTAICSNCKERNAIVSNEEPLYCKSCGIAILIKCPACNGIHDVETEFCQKTGKNIDEFKEKQGKLDKLKNELTLLRHEKTGLMKNRPSVTAGYVLGLIGFISLLLFTWLMSFGAFITLTQRMGEMTCAEAIVGLALIPGILVVVFVKLHALFPYVQRKKKFDTRLSEFFGREKEILKELSS